MQLRAALQNPALSAEQRRDLQARLALVGQPKVYAADSPPVPGAIQLPPPLVEQAVSLPVLDRKTVQGLTKAELQQLAIQRGLDSTGTRADLIKRLIP
jgi:hypothetical protein